MSTCFLDVESYLWILRRTSDGSFVIFGYDDVGKDVHFSMIVNGRNAQACIGDVYHFGTILDTGDICWYNSPLKKWTATRLSIGQLMFVCRPPPRFYTPFLLCLVYYVFSYVFSYVFQRLSTVREKLRLWRSSL